MQRRQTSNLCAVALVLLTACASDRMIRRVQDFRAAKERGDTSTAQSSIAPGARLWFENKAGEGEPYTLDGGSWDHWDQYFHSHNVMTNWRRDGNAVMADVVETNDFMQMLEYRPAPYTMTWWLDDQRRITGVLIKSNPAKPVNRMGEFKEWARGNHPDELAYLLPNGRLDPTGDRPERWRAILTEWRNAIRQ
jgi:hypothetical protein